VGRRKHKYHGCGFKRAPAREMIPYMAEAERKIDLDSNRILHGMGLRQLLLEGLSPA
jgi:hypothetical protein